MVSEVWWLRMLVKRFYRWLNFNLFMGSPVALVSSNFGCSNYVRSWVFIYPACQSFTKIWARTGWLIRKGFSSFDCLSWYLLWRDCCFIRFRRNRLWQTVFGVGSCLVQETTNLRFLLIRSCDWYARSSTGVLLYSSSAKLKSCPAVSVLIRMSLTVRTVFLC